MLFGLTRYIFWQAAGPFLVATFTLTGIIWLTQALKMLDVLITQGQTVGTFFELSLLALPSAVNTVLPIALFCALLYTLNKLITDSELVVMFSAGVSRWSITVPVLTLTALVMVVVIALNLYFMPAGMRELRQKLFAIRGDVATSLIREGAFTNPVPGLTVYVRSRTPEGSIRGILVHDERNLAQPVTYMAETGELVRSSEGARLVMYNGNIERVIRNPKANDTPVSLLYFDKYTYDLTQYASAQKATEYEVRDRYLNELFNPASTDLYGQMYRARLRAEGHDRLVAALYPLMFSMIALAALLPAPFNRRGYTLRIAGAAVVAIVARVIGFGLVNIAATQPIFIPLIYLLPLGICAAAGAVISGTRFDVLRRRILAWRERLPQIGAGG
ncbi:MAG: LPS export ABC transporter permease LptF [Parvibaculum sp.]|uniref:LPS export ABC transporter permease LptF n=1 Tax=Parvibaculum sp. TaxID=2024848 RepID=UPI0028457B50|nr:LPS export ABC transporter permease LptF [Parvibaculum sp.]MDR3498551.1 LPS export ABC transporter permease LptF [Parvibaculum sp.]